MIYMFIYLYTLPIITEYLRNILNFDKRASFFKTLYFKITLYRCGPIIIPTSHFRNQSLDIDYRVWGVPYFRNSCDTGCPIFFAQ